MKILKDTFSIINAKIENLADVFCGNMSSQEPRRLDLADTDYETHRIHQKNLQSRKKTVMCILWFAIVWCSILVFGALSALTTSLAKATAAGIVIAFDIKDKMLTPPESVLTPEFSSPLTPPIIESSSELVEESEPNNIVPEENLTENEYPPDNMFEIIPEEIIPEEIISEEPITTLESEEQMLHRNIVSATDEKEQNYTLSYTANFTLLPKGENSVLSEELPLSIKMIMRVDGNQSEGVISVILNNDRESAIDYIFYQTIQNWNVYTCVQDNDGTWYFMAGQSDRVGVDLSAIVEALPPMFNEFSSMKTISYDSQYQNHPVFGNNPVYAYISRNGDLSVDMMGVEFSAWDIHEQRDLNARTMDKTLDILLENEIVIAPNWEYHFIAYDYGQTIANIERYEGINTKKANGFNFIGEDMINMIKARY